MTSRFGLLIAAIVLSISPFAGAADWPTYLANSERGAVTAEALSFPLKQAWVRTVKHAPRPAWPPPANVPNLDEIVHFDRAFQPVVAGGLLYFGSSVDDTVYCIDAATSKPKWSFTTEGPIRLAPVIAEGRALVASDDGHLYCLDAKTGKLKWRYRIGPADRRIAGNGRMVSAWPVRSGIIVKDGIAHAAAGIFPTYGVYLCGVRVEDGKEVWKTKMKVPAQGYMVEWNNWLFVPTGRTAPRIYDRRTGKLVKPVPGYRNLGGAYMTMVGDLLFHTFCESGGMLAFQPKTNAYPVHSRQGRRMITGAKIAYALTPTQVEAFDRAALWRKQFVMKWKMPIKGGYALAMAGDVVLAGGKDKIAAFGATDGKAIWTAKVKGTVHGLAVSNGLLIAATDTGSIYCFANKPAADVFDAEKAAAALGWSFGGYPAAYKRAAEEAMAASATKRGYCLVLGVGDGALAQRIAATSKMRVIAVDGDKAKVEAARKRLRSTGVYGSRVVVHHVASDQLPYADGVANLIVSEEATLTGKIPFAASEVVRLLRPSGGVLSIAGKKGKLDAAALKVWEKQLPGWKVETKGDWVSRLGRRGALEGAGEWTHLYADAGNTACSGDSLVKGPFDLQWFGEPGPRMVANRHLRSHAPLYKNGVMYVPAGDSVIAVDAYNGTIFWRQDVPGAIRLGFSRDGGSFALTDDYVYVAAGSKCVLLDVTTGKRSRTLSIPKTKSKNPEWGYLAVTDQVVLGSMMKPGAAIRKRGGEGVKAVNANPVVCSGALFAVDRRTGRLLWSHVPKKGVIMNPAIAASDKFVCYVASADPKTKKVASGRIPVADLVKEGADLVALDAGTGKVVWRRYIDVKSLRHAIYLSYSRKTLVVAGVYPVGGNARYNLWAFNDADGKPLWTLAQPDDVRMTGHGEHEQHPAIIGDVVYTNPLSYNLRTGKKSPGWRWKQGGHGCGTISTSAKYMFNRGGQPLVTEIATGKQQRLTEVTRPGCWINIIPAGGLVLIPEASSQCGCAYAIQTSLGLVPKKPGK